MLAARERWPRWLAVVAALFVATLIPLATLGDWVGDDIVDRDGWVGTLGPLADDDRIVEAVAAQVTDGALEIAGDALRSSFPFLPGSIVDDLADRAAGVIAPIVGRVMETDLVSRAWDAALRLAHPQVLALLGRGDTLFVDGAEIVLDLTPIADRVREEVDGALDALFGDIELPFGIGIPDDPLGLGRLDVRFELVDLSESERELRIADDAERSTWVFLVLAGVAAVATVLVAEDRVAGLAMAASAAALGSTVLWVSLRLDRPEDPAGYGIAFDRIVDQVMTTSRAVGVVATLVLAGAVAVKLRQARRAPTATAS